MSKCVTSLRLDFGSNVLCLSTSVVDREQRGETKREREIMLCS